MAQGVGRRAFDRSRGVRGVAEALAAREGETNRLRAGAFDAMTGAGLNPESAGTLTGVLDFLPVVGDAAGAEDAWQGFSRGDMVGGGVAAGATLLGMLPGVGDFAGKAVRAAADVASGASRALPMDEAARMTRAKEMGYLAEPFYRGDKSPPEAFQGGAFFSRDKSYSDGFAGDGNAVEYRLAPTRTLAMHSELTLGDWADLVEASDTPELAQRLVDAAPIAGKWDVPRFLSAARANADVGLMRGAAAVQLLENVAGGSEWLLKRAGFDAIDTGRDVRKLTALGIRRKDAAFDPAMRGSPLVTAAVPLGLGFGAYGVASSNEDR